jgi:hypothetical protein
MLGVDPNDSLVALQELTSRAVPTEFARELRRWAEGFQVKDWVCDSLGSSELTGGDGNLSFIAVLNRGGIRVRATTYREKDAESFIQMIQEVLVIPPEPDQLGRTEARLKVAHDCRLLITDIEQCAWAKYKNIDETKPSLEISNRDALSALKYALAAQPRFDKGREKIIRSKTVGITGRHGTFRTQDTEEDW